MTDRNRHKGIELPFPPPPFWKLLGIEVTEMSEGYARLIMPFHEKLTQPYGIAHGGALFSLADSAAAIAILSVSESSKKFLTIEMKINFLSPVNGGAMEARARVLRKGRIVPVEVEVLNNDELVAKGIATYIILDGNKKVIAF